MTNHGAIELAGGAVQGDGDLAQSASGVVGVALATQAVSSPAPLVVSGNVTLDGTLDVSADNFTPAPLGLTRACRTAHASGASRRIAGWTCPAPLR